jgi:hypothetical protein
VTFHVHFESDAEPTVEVDTDAEGGHGAAAVALGATAQRGRPLGRRPCATSGQGASPSLS